MVRTEIKGGEKASVRKKQPELLQFTFRNVVGDIYEALYRLVFDPKVNRIVLVVVVSLSSIISRVVMSIIPYTEIDFSTYMQQIQLINDGEIDYTLIIGDTGPMVYPAGFVHIYQLISSLTNNGEDIATAQILFGYLFTFTNLLVLLTYTMTNRISPWPFYLLLASKRLISIYVLRLFNDCFTTFSMVGVTLFLQQASYWHKSSSIVSFLLVLAASDLFSIAISIKMNALLYLPGFLVVTYFLVEENIQKFLVVLGVIPMIQILIGWKFLLPLFHDEVANTIRWNYISQAFDFKRKFLYVWTVNWKFIPEHIFSSDGFANSLLLLHLSILLIFTFTRYLNRKIIGKSIQQLTIDVFKPKSTIASNNLFINQKLGPQIILLVLSTTNVIGVLFSRSLHYQFFSWYCWQLPFLLHSTGWNIITCGVIWVAHELCWWIVFPATAVSSALLVSTLAITLYGVWNNESIWFDIKPDTNDNEDTKIEPKS